MAAEQASQKHDVDYAMMREHYARSCIPTCDEEVIKLRACLDMGARDGCTSLPAMTVDGFSLASNLQVLDELRCIASGTAI